MLNRLKLLLYTHFLGQKVGTDAFGNQYFQHKHPKNTKKWVVYNGINDPSKIPVNWYMWLHSNIKDEPKENLSSWQPNVTQTPFAFKGTNSIENIEPNRSNNYSKWVPKTNPK